MHCRQFPEFTERARKRIRTYLKSCRRTRKHKSTSLCTSSDTSAAKNEAEVVASSSSSSPLSSSPNVHSAVNGASSSQLNIGSGGGGGGGGSGSSSHKSNHNASSSNGQMVSFTSSGNSYHMTSSLAEQILATACDNEYQNAKRMRLGLKPLAVDYDDVDMSNCFTSASMGTSVGAVSVLKAKNSAHTSSSLLAALCQQQQSDLCSESKLRSLQCISTNGSGSGSGAGNSHSKRSLTCSHFLDSRENNALVSTCDARNTESLVNCSGNSVTSVTGIASDFSVCDSIRPQAGNTSNQHQHHQAAHSLNPTETAMVKQLISGYRESAAFLLRSADELEQLLLRQA